MDRRKAGVRFCDLRHGGREPSSVSIRSGGKPYSRRFSGVSGYTKSYTNRAVKDCSKLHELEKASAKNA